jgi:two-component system response regulator AtoC
MTERGQFRLDLFYRLNVVPLWLPPLRARREDIEILAWHFLKECADHNGRSGINFTPEALQALRSQKWPGNVRQLQNFVERLVVLSPGPVIGEPEVRGELARHVPFTTQPGTASLVKPALETAAKPVAATTSEATGTEIRSLEVEVRAAEKHALERALRATKRNRSLAARLLGVSRSTLYLKLKEHGLL